MYPHPFLSDPYGEYTWCSECMRVFRTATWVAHEWKCPYGECGAPASYAWRWESVLKRKPQFPKEPEEGALFSLYGG